MDSSSTHGGVPSSFLCPITQEVMRDPVLACSGFSFERSAIVDWLSRGNDTCPMTRMPLAPSKIITNAALYKKIQSWHKERGLEIPSISHEDRCIVAMFTLEIPTDEESSVSEETLDGNDDVDDNYNSNNIEELLNQQEQQQSRRRRNRRASNGTSSRSNRRQSLTGTGRSRNPFRMFQRS